MLRSEFLLLLASIWHADPHKPCMLELDVFGLLVFLTYLMPFALCHTYDVTIYSKNYKTASQSTSSQKDEDDASSPGRMSIQPPVGSVLDHHNLRLMFTIHVYQLIVSVDNLAEFTFPHDDQCDCHLSTMYTGLHADDEWSSFITAVGFNTTGKLRPLLFYLWAKPREALQENNPVRQAFSTIRAHLDCDKVWEHVSQRT